MTHVEQASEKLTHQHRKELSQLQAALEAAEAAKQKVEQQQAEHSCSGQSDVQAAQAGQAEATARAAALQSQIDTLKAQGAASRSGLQEEVNSAKVTPSLLVNQSMHFISGSDELVWYSSCKFNWQSLYCLSLWITSKSYLGKAPVEDLPVNLFHTVMSWSAFSKKPNL